MADTPIRIGIVAGESSGDILGASLIRALRQKHGNVQFEGVAGPLMQAEGCKALYPMESLAVMGLVEVLGSLRRLLGIRKTLRQHFVGQKPDLFIGIDAPDFNIPLELQLRQQGIKTLQYVSPSVWAWRPKRIFKIDRATDLVLALLPFEKAFYDQHQVPCEFVGHTLADEIPLTPDKGAARQVLGYSPDEQILAILPGSRSSEIKMLLPDFLKAAQILKSRHPQLRLAVPMVNAARREQFEAIKSSVAADLPVDVFDGRSREVMTAADATLLASGTATLEAMLCKSPMVVAYRFNPVSYWVFSRMINTRYFSLPNLLSDEPLVAELLQDNVSASALVDEIEPFLMSTNESTIKRFTELHKQIRCDASDRAAQAVLDLIKTAKP